MRWTATLDHRGPDGKGIWLDREGGVGLSVIAAFAIVDSVRRRPPADAVRKMKNLVDGRSIGEIYNFRHSAAGTSRPKAIAFRGNSDTEVMLAAFWKSYGIEESAQAGFPGMFCRRHLGPQTSGCFCTLFRDPHGQEAALYCSH